MNSIDDFVALVRDQVGLAVTRAELGVDLDELPGWDSVHLLTLLVAIERAIGRPVPMVDVLEAPSLERIWELVTSR